jgi:HD-GYP domain-containing protein (c-di-GMP phosphodiesterase class II)
MGSRVIAVADYFDALTHKRHYREPMPIHDVVQLIRDQSGTAFDPDVVAAFEEFVYKEYIPAQQKRAARELIAGAEREEGMTLPAEATVE